jgi:hypothetical protein
MSFIERVGPGWKAIPVIGTIYRLRRGQKEDIKNKIPKEQMQSKDIWHGLTSSLIIMGAMAYGGNGIKYHAWNPIKQIKVSREVKKQKELEAEIRAKHKQELTGYIDVNNDGEISLSEQHYLYTLMEIENKSRYYKPTSEDWERAYSNAFPKKAQE